MGTGLCIKDVEFNGAMLRAAEVENIIYVGVRWICQGLGFNEGKVKSERKENTGRYRIKPREEISSLGK